MLPAAFFLTTCLLPSIQTCNNFKLICLDNSQLRNPRFLCDKVVNVNSASTSCTQTGLTPGTNGVCTNGVCTNGLQPTGARGNTDISDGASCSGVSEVQEEVQADKLEEVEGVRLAVEVHTFRTLKDIRIHPEAVKVAGGRIWREITGLPLSENFDGLSLTGAKIFAFEMFGELHQF